MRARTAAVLVGAAVLASAACGAPDPPPGRTPAPARALPTVAVRTPTAAPGPTVAQIADALDAVEPTRHPRDNTGSCAATAGCVGLVTAGRVSIYQWPSVSSAARFVGDGGNAERIGPYVLSYRTREQRVTPPEVRKAYADKVRELVGPAP
ncbi:MAG: hypothetical protein QOK35_1589 [Pseudonocardiales bacterium]|nr:hypothetical protein [Pseudonocardiales bacterium]